MAALENYLIRRFVCDYKSNQLNTIFPAAYAAIQSSPTENLAEAFKTFLSAKGYPKDAEFKAKFRETRMYGGGERKAKAKFILESLEESYQHKERIDMSSLSIEHIMPQTLSEWWQDYLGNEWETVHDELLDTIGNLTLTAYNSELSNDDFDTKRTIYAKSHLELNKYLADILVWNREQMEQRSTILADRALNVWPTFEESETASQIEIGISHSTPKGLEFAGETFDVKSWRDVFEHTMNVLAEKKSDKFESVVASMPTYVGKDKNKFRAIRRLRNGYYIEVNQSAPLIHKNCQKAIQAAGLSVNDWNVKFHTGNEGKQTSAEEKKKMESGASEHNSNAIKEICVDMIARHFGVSLEKHGDCVYKTADSQLGFYFSFSKVYAMPHFNRYWFAYRRKSELHDCKECYYVLACHDEKTVIVLSQKYIEEHLPEMNASNKATGKGLYWHIVFKIAKDGRVRWALPKPKMHEIDLTNQLLEQH